MQDNTGGEKRGANCVHATQMSPYAEFGLFYLPHHETKKKISATYIQWGELRYSRAN